MSSKDQSPAPAAAAPEDRGRPEPAAIRFYGTSWLDHSRGYLPRRFLLGLGASLLAVAGVLLLRLAYDGLELSETSDWLRVLLVVAFALCSSIAFTRTWGSYRRPAALRGDEPSFASIKLIGFIGVLLAYALRSGIEAPGEGLRRAEYERALEQYERRGSRRSGNPSRRTKKRT
ncbi:hypothetical protein [Streptomyces aidingensis]|uniref:Uncharacterized protein n=1 Tax=Streptomyces aidingensis TaxID=910347 RepID=A0A1I1TG75_9ACTN|nr:hypothetical protein [Streptomyces aidingensis]SFD55383.1 hypothetical protein SAMN05421773_1198 [Streptomyces aidingensis]